MERMGISLIGQKFDLSIYGNWDYEGFAILDGLVYAAGADGLYLVGGSTTDAGAAIVTGVVTAPSNLGHWSRKVMHQGFVDDDAVLEVQVDGEAGRQNTSRSGRLPLGSDEIGNDFVLRVQGFERLRLLELFVRRLSR